MQLLKPKQELTIFKGVIVICFADTLSLQKTIENLISSVKNGTILL